MNELERQLIEAIQLFEPRILRHTLQVKATVERHLISFEIRGDLWANPVPEHLFINTKIDLETGQTLLGDRPDG
jgi:type VI secretion system protein ImpF